MWRVRSQGRVPAFQVAPSSADVSHSAIQSGFAAPLMLARSQSGLYFEERGNRSEMVGWPEIVWVSVLEL